MKECVILAGGFGTRLQSVVKDIPKCMADISGRPFLYYLLKYLEKESFDRVVLSLGYKHEIVTEWLSQNDFDFDLNFVVEEKPLGTGGAIKYAQTKIESDIFFIINGDTFFDIDTSDFLSFHEEKKSDISIALKPMVHFERYGSVLLNENQQIEAFNEKQYCESGVINGGIYIIDKKLFSEIYTPSVFSFEKDVLEKQIKNIRIFGMIRDHYFIDIGVPEDYEKANNDFYSFQI